MNHKKDNISDDYFNNGDMELLRCGNIVSMKNNVSSEKYKSMIETYSAAYLDSKKEIDGLVQQIRSKISNCNPLGLLNFMVSMSYLSLMNTTSEIQLEAENNQILRSVEYVQSVLVSSESNYTLSDVDLEDESFKYEEVLNDVIELQNKIYMFYFFWTSHVLSQDEQADNGALQYIIESQISGFVRGERYQYYQIEHLKSLIQPHDSIMKEIFNVSADEFIDGLKKLEHSLSSGKGDASNDFRKSFENFAKIISEGKTDSEIQTYFESLRDGKMQCIEDMFGYSLYDVSAVTGWSDILINSLSLSINEYDRFYYEGDFSGWPIIDLPIQKKPFIKIDNISYCFDYYSLFDNIYRVLQKTIKEIKPAYVDTWSHIQQNTSEIMVEDLMKKILPGCQTYRDNYYPKKNSLKDCAENDILVVYDDVLFIIEVKAGSFVYTPAITDYKAHIKSFQTLIEKADYQCNRTSKYVQAHPIALIYDREKNKKVDLAYCKYSEIYTVCVTVDNFNEFAAKAEKLSFIKLQSDTIALSIDDLRVYSDIFDNPLCFMHYFKQRKKAVQTPQIALNDELDHLGLYLNRNIYTMDAEELDANAHLSAIGFREDIDNYFASLHNEKLCFDKPSQNIPIRIQEIIDFMSQYNISGRGDLSAFLLNFDFQGRREFSDVIEYSLVRQREINRMTRVITFGEIRYCLLVYQPDIEKMNKQERDDYIYAAMLMHNEPDRLCINLHYGNNNELVKVDFRTYFSNEIPEERHEQLKALGEYFVRSRVETYKQQNNMKKIGRNDPCPCGSGKKFKKCCSDKF